MKGLINLFKPKGMTSSDVVIKVKKILNEKRVGHMGTLDPMGEGVLLLGVGKAARLFEFFLGKDKVYRANFCFGYETDTLDIDGKVVAHGGRIPKFSEVLDVSRNFIGKIEQLPPKFSAKSINGERAYKKARRGEDFELKPEEISIYDLDVRENGSGFEFTVHCSSGTYIRCLGRDIAHKLNTYATMTDIIRIKSGPFDVKDSITLEELNCLREKALLSLEDVLSSIDRIDIPGEMYQRLNNGAALDVEPFNEQKVIYCNDELFGLGSAPQGVLRINTYLKD